jgi:hypothetical protein
MSTLVIRLVGLALLEPGGRATVSGPGRCRIMCESIV